MSLVKEADLGKKHVEVRTTELQGNYFNALVNNKDDPKEETIENVTKVFNKLLHEKRLGTNAMKLQEVEIITKEELDEICDIYQVQDAMEGSKADREGTKEGTVQDGNKGR